MLRQAARYADEVRVWVDDATTDDSCEVARRETPHVEHVRIVERHIEPALIHIYETLTTDWVLRLDDDEMMGQLWMDRWHDYLAFSTHGLLMPRLHVADPGRTRAVMCPPFYPDHQIRLTRRGCLKHSGQVHTGGTVIGRRGALPCHIFHLRYVQRTPEELQDIESYYLRAMGALPTDPAWKERRKWGTAEWDPKDEYEIARHFPMEVLPTWEY